jgi:hypothetical protein
MHLLGAFFVLLFGKQLFDPFASLPAVITWRFRMSASTCAVACALLFASAAFAAEPMTPSVGHFNGQPFTASTPSGTQFTMTFTPDGKMIREPLAQAGYKDNRTWKLNAKGFCTTWQHAKPNCFTVAPNGENKWSVLKGGTTIATTVAVWSK